MGECWKSKERFEVVISKSRGGNYQGNVVAGHSEDPPKMCGQEFKVKLVSLGQGWEVSVHVFAHIYINMHECCCSQDLPFNHSDPQSSTGLELISSHTHC